MKHKKKIKDEILKILEESGVEKKDWSKVLAKLVNYTYKVKFETTNGEWHGSAEF